jgi:hypothetical protein
MGHCAVGNESEATRQQSHRGVSARLSVQQGKRLSQTPVHYMSDPAISPKSGQKFMR